MLRQPPTRGRCPAQRREASLLQPVKPQTGESHEPFKAQSHASCQPLPAPIFISPEDPFICIFEVPPDEFLRRAPSLKAPPRSPSVSGSSRPGRGEASRHRHGGNQKQVSESGGARVQQHLDRRDAAKLQTLDAPAASDRLQ